MDSWKYTQLRRALLRPKFHTYTHFPPAPLSSLAYSHTLIFSLLHTPPPSATCTHLTCSFFMETCVLVTQYSVTSDINMLACIIAKYSQRVSSILSSLLGQRVSWAVTSLAALNSYTHLTHIQHHIWNNWHVFLVVVAGFLRFLAGFSQILRFLPVFYGFWPVFHGFCRFFHGFCRFLPVFACFHGFLPVFAGFLWDFGGISQFCSFIRFLCVFCQIMSDYAIFRS